MNYHGSREAYSEKDIAIIPCSRCGDPSTHQWQACANDCRWLGVCLTCDIQLNALVLTFLRVPNSVELSRAYADSVFAEK
jgi:hypothetical protein